ncbi:MAG: hypothetical protein DDT18_00357 [Actinobacteria bacterium]|nr:hypothetical protein [Actinomycetota bacterium]
MTHQFLGRAGNHGIAAVHHNYVVAHHSGKARDHFLDLLPVSVFQIAIHQKGSQALAPDLGTSSEIAGELAASNKTQSKAGQTHGDQDNHQERDQKLRVESSQKGHFH